MTDEHERTERHDDPRREPAPAPAPRYVTHIDTVHGGTFNIGSTVYGGPAPSAPPPEPAGAGYNVAAIRRLLLEAFTMQELPRFCRDHPRFREVVYRFGPNHGLDDMVDELIQYCTSRFCWEELLAAVQAANPDQYARFAAQVRVGPAAPPAVPPLVELLPASLLDDLGRRVRDYAPAGRRDEAARQVAALRGAVAGPALDLARVQAVWRWFDAELPALSGPVLSVVLELGRRLQAGAADDLWAEFQERFRDDID